ncbi:GNAT family N-acetyltransferase [Halalkalibacter nanhaiisediminis]|uniref:GNAT family N-acetyltransferase n=1 Tax=Halalkalibacter nanhaiisediminis TaxID=688079 RepID=UPI0011A8EFA0|nr:GNAT family N-acetyltransferase [Halalkalibacter nanhaiisediminis]
MDIRIQRTTKGEVSELLKIQKEVFQADLQRYKDYESSPATESHDSFIQRINESFHYTIFIEGELAGGINIWKITSTHMGLFRIFLKEHFQNRGYGSEIMRLVEHQFPEAQKWSLNTPKDNVRNRYFYERIGYQKIGELQVNDKLILIEYEKEF